MLLFELLQVALGNSDELLRVPNAKEWISLFEESDKQSILGVMLDGLERLPNEQMPPKDLLLQWIGLTQMIEQNTQKLTKASKEVVAHFRENGFACTILKGVTVGRFYPQPNRRSSGDVDVWVKGGRKKIYDYARKHDKEGSLHGVTYHHIHFDLLEDVEVEVHIWPSFLSSPLRNHRLQKFCRLYEPTFDTVFPSLAFNRVFILLHCYQHLCGHGVGLRQLMDYYYVLKQGFNDKERDDTVRWIKKLGMYRFCGGVMWIFQHYFALKDEYLLINPNEKEGRFVIKEVMMTGNMGHNDSRNWGSTKTPISRFFFNLKRDFYLAKHYPHEALWQPVFSIYFYMWRVLKGHLK